MSVGPRLDRPSAIGDEGRARAASLGIASVVLAGTMVAVAYFGNLVRPFQTTIFGAGLVVGGVGLVRRENLSAMAMGQLMFLPGGVVMLAGMATSLLAGGSVAGNFLFAFGVGVAAIGLGGSWANVDYESSVAAAKQGWAAALVPFIGIVVLSIAGSAAWIVFRLSVSSSVQGTASVSGFFFLLCVTIVAIRIAVGKLPISELADRDRRDEIERRRQRWQTVTNRGSIVAAVLWVVVGLLEITGIASATVVYQVAVLVFGSPVLRVPIFLVGVVAVLSVLVAWVVRQVTRGRDESAHLIAPVVGGVALLGIPAPILLLLLRGVSEGGRTGMRLSVAAVFAAMLVVIAAVIFLLAFSAGPVAVKLDLLPDRAGSISLASAGALVAATGAALISVRPALAFAAVAAAMIVWDTSEFGLGLTVELGHIPDTRRLELVHGVAGLAIGVVAVLVATGIDAAFRAMSPSEPILAAMVLSVGGVLLLLVPLRG